jgi:hypothetical protein
MDWIAGLLTASCCFPEGARFTTEFLTTLVRIPFDFSALPQFPLTKRIFGVGAIFDRSAGSAFIDFWTVRNSRGSFVIAGSSLKSSSRSEAKPRELKLIDC